MAVLPFDLDEEERQRQEQGGNVQLAGEGVGGTPGGGDEGGAPTGASPQQAGTSGFTDVNAYLDANKDQALGMADRIGTKLEGEASTIRGDIDTSNLNFRKKVDDNTERLDQDLLGRASADPLAFSKNADDVARIKKMRDAQYGGPGGLEDAEDFGALTEKVSAAAARGRGVDSETGREALLSSIMTNPTKGMLSLDNLLIGANPGARERLSNAAKPFAELDAYLDTTGKDAGAYVDAARKATADTRTGVNTGLESTRGRLDTELNTKFADTKTRATTESGAAQEKLKNYLSGGVNSLTPRDLEILGIDQATASELFGTGYKLKHAGDGPVTGNTPNGQIRAWWQYGTPEFYNTDFDPTLFGTMQSADAQITKANSASGEDYQRIAALEDLMGNPSGVLNQADAGLAGTANTDLYDFRGGEATSGAKNLLKSKDKQMVSYGMGFNGADISEEQMANWANGHKGFFDNVMTGRLPFHSTNPESNARGIASIRALARLGLYQMPPGAILTDPGMGGDAFTVPEGA